MVEREPRQAGDPMPGRVLRERRIDSRRNEPEIGRCDLPLGGVALWIAERPELLEVGDLAHVDLGGQVSLDRLLERLSLLEVAAGERPRPEKRFASALPEQRLQRAA